MIIALVRMLALVALMLMPFGMNPTSAAAERSSTMQTGHCAGKQEQDQDETAKDTRVAHCASGCVALLPQPVGSRGLPAMTVSAPAGAATFSLLDDLPETATPPPKLL